MRESYTEVLHRPGRRAFTRWMSPLFLFLWGLGIGMIYTSKLPDAFLLAFSILSCLLILLLIGRLWWGQLRLLKWTDAAGVTEDPRQEVLAMEMQGNKRREAVTLRKRAQLGRRNGRTVESISGSAHTLLHTNNCQLRRELAKNLLSQLN